ncbi:FG-GAP-like repeat-containing protein [Streptomyces sp. NPDC048111]|uniref:FG-GAP-like repeat-containing protein n=1 Tax=Streptomyces sp. NPDC048111 TaxID=3365500 RepID=UPI003712FA6E
MSAKSARAAWLTGLFAVTTAAGLLSAAPAGAVVGSDVQDGDYGYTVKLNIGDKQACSGALVGAEWVVTATSCLADGGQPVKTGAPTVRTTVTVGRNDLSQSAGSIVDVVDIRPRDDRDLSLVRLAWPVVNVPAISVAATAPAAAEQLTMSGFGRTKTEWVPNKMHSAAFTVTGVDGTSVNLNGSADAVMCQGDAGAPAVRNNNGKFELVAINSRSWQGGCLGTDVSEVRTGAVDTRVDDLNSWIRTFVSATVNGRSVDTYMLPKTATTVMTAGDFNRDGRTDIAVVSNSGTLSAYAGRPDGTFESSHSLWTDASWKEAKKIIAGDFNGDGLTDIASVWSDGRLRLYAGKTDGKLAPGTLMWPEGTDWNGMLQLARFKSDNSGRDGLIAVWGAGPAGALYAYPTNSAGALDGSKKSMWAADGSWKYASKFTTGDFNGDGRDDVVITDSGNLIRYNGNAQGGLDARVSMWRDNSWGAAQLLMAGDFNGDGKTDIGSLWGNQQHFNLYRGNGAGALAEGTEAWPHS